MSESPEDQILAACEEGERLRGEATASPWHQDLNGPWKVHHGAGCDRIFTGHAPDKYEPGNGSAIGNAAFIVHAANHSPWGALRVLTDAIDFARFGYHEESLSPEVDAYFDRALSEAARVLQGQERKGE